MKTPLLSTFVGLVLFSLLPAHAQPEPKKSARVLTIGNSFTQDSTNHLQALAKEGGKELVLLNLVKGGCSLQEHSDALAASEATPESDKARIYRALGSGAGPLASLKKVNLPEALKSGAWDYISIHQFSYLSYKPETYEPYAGNLVKFLRSQAPNSEIVVHESWAYREDDPLFKKGDLSREKMYEGLKAAYAKMAGTYGLRIIPIGDAFQAASKLPMWTYQRDPAFNFASPEPGTLPKDTGSLHVGWIWKKPTQNTATPDISPDNTGQSLTNPHGKFTLDAHHANTAGDYLGSCVWYEEVFQDDVTKVTGYTPKGLTAEQAASLRQVAHDTVAQQKVFRK